MILLFGQSGQLGGELRRTLQTLGGVLAPGREEIDLVDPEGLRRALSGMPEIAMIVNAAAYTDVDAAERERALCRTINVEAPILMAREATRRGIPLIHFSSNGVFSGIDRTTPYREEETPNPLNVYARSKYDAEPGIAEATARYLIFRLSDLYGGRRSSFVERIVDAAFSGKPLRVVRDQIGTPNWTRRVAETVTEVLATFFPGSRENVPWGLYHMTGSGAISRYDFAVKIVEALRKTAFPELPPPVSIATGETGDRAPRPRYAVLDAEKLRHRFGVAMPEAERQFEDYWKEVGSTIVSQLKEKEAEQ